MTSPHSNPQEHATEWVAALKSAHADELQRATLSLAERVRQSEVARLKLEERYDALEERHFAALDERMSEAARLSVQLAELHQRLDLSAQQITSAAQAREALLSRIDSAETKRRQAESALEDLSSRRKVEETQRLMLQKQLSEQTARADLLKTELSEKSQAIGQLNRHIEALTAQATALRQQLAERSETLVRAEQALAQARHALAEQEAEKRQFATEWAALQRQHAELSDAAANDARRATELQQHLTGMEAEQYALKASLDEQTQRAQDLITQKDSLASANTRLSTALDDSRLAQAALAARMTTEIAALSQERDRATSQLARMADTWKTESLRHARESANHAVQLAASHQELMRHRSALIHSERRVEASKQTLSFRLGQALIQASKSWTAAVQLPLVIYRIRREAQRKGLITQKHSGQDADQASASAWMNEIENTWAREGLDAAQAYAEGRARSPQELATALTRLARLSIRTDAQTACRLGQRAVDLDPRPFRLKWFGFLLFDAGHVLRSHEVLMALPKDIDLKPSERHKRLQIEGCADLLLQGMTLPLAQTVPAFTPVAGRMLYVASSALPHHTSGYTLRTQGLLQAWQQAGGEVVCAVRPGYPFDRNDVHGPMPDESADSRYEVGGVPYQLLPGPHRRRLRARDYVEASARSLEALARHSQAAFIQAASNHESALPALIAARRLGLPFVYEVRGLWEYTAASKTPGWETTERFGLERQLETLVATNADRVFTLTAALARELEQRGVHPSRLKLVPNAVDANTPAVGAREAALATELGIAQDAFVVGYLGSVVGYEGLDDLVTAMVDVVHAQPTARLLVVGDGDALPALRAQASALGLADAVVFTGRVAPANVMRYYSCMNVVALPRKPVKVCELVSPIKPLEVMAAGLPLVVSDVQALAEMVSDGQTGLVHRAGDARHLAQRLLEIARDPTNAIALGRAGRAHTLAHRCWTHVLADMRASLAELQVLAKPNTVVADRSTAPHPGLTLLTTPGGRNGLTAEEKTLLTANLHTATQAGGPPAVQEYLHAQTEAWPPKLRAFAQIKAAQALLAAGAPDAAFGLSDAALLLDPGVSTLRAALRIRYNGADMRGALALAQRLRPLAAESDHVFLDEVEGRARLVEWASLPGQPRTLPIQPRRVLNFLAFSLPYTSVGYATRSHGLAQGIQAHGWDMRPYTRPGFPFDFKPELEGQELPDQDTIDGITYRRIFDTQRRGTNEVRYLLEAIEHCERVITEEQPAVVHAASNYVTALPALIAARRLGVPFVYEVRGFWEVTRSSRDETFKNTPKYRFMQLFEALVARQADRVITITSAMQEELIAMGVAPQSIDIAFNSVDPERFIPRERDTALAERLGIPPDTPVIGYIGSFVDYEGLDDLLHACAGLKAEGKDFWLLLVGDGAAFDSLAVQIKDLGLQDRVSLTGRVPHEEVEHYYSLVDIAPFPRKPWEVCELVSPLKPYEAMALEKAVLVSSTRALQEIVDSGRNGQVFEKGNVGDLQAKLAELISDRGKRATLGTRAREWVIAQRSWKVAGSVACEGYRMATPV